MPARVISASQARCRAKKRIKLRPVPDGFKCPTETNICYLGRVQAGHVVAQMTLDELDKDNVEDE